MAKSQKPCFVVQRTTGPVTDRAQRYRAHQCPPPDPRLCLFCWSDQSIDIGHLNGDESDFRPENLCWTCRSCNTKMGQLFARMGVGKRTHQYNPARGATSLGAWLNAVSSIKGEGGSMSIPAAVAMIHSTPAATRTRFAKEIWRARRRHYGRTGRSDSDVPF